MRAIHPLLAFLRSNAPLLAALIFLAACDGAVEPEPVAEPSVIDRVEILETPSTDLTGLQGRLAFVSERSGNSDIYSINADGTGLARLTADRGNNTNPAWSPDGNTIAFESDGRIMTMAGRKVAVRGNGWNPAWSPDGSVLAFAALLDGNVSIATIDNTGAAPRVLTSKPGANIQPSWAPDGSKIAFVSDYAAYDLVEDIYTVNADGTDRRQVTQGFAMWPDQRHYLHPAWSPDGSTIAFVYGTIVPGSEEDQSDAAMNFTVAIMSADGVFIEDLAPAGQIPWLEALDPGSLAWSPDGQGIAYSSVGSSPRSVKYVSLDGKAQGTIVKNAHSPSWRP